MVSLAILSSTKCKEVSPNITSRQMVKVDGLISRVIEVTSSVPQGSHLGSLLFILFFNVFQEISHVLAMLKHSRMI